MHQDSVCVVLEHTDENSMQKGAEVQDKAGDSVSVHSAVKQNKSRGRYYG